MDITGIKKEINRIGQMIEGWDSAVSDIERGIVLDKLKAIYEEVMFFGQGDAARPENPARQAFEDNDVQDAPVSEVVQPVAAASAPIEPAFEFLGTVTAEEEQTPDPDMAEPAVTVRPHTSEAELETGEQARRPIRRPLQKEIIRSLYGDDPLPVNNHNDAQEEAGANIASAETVHEPSLEETPVEIQAEVSFESTEAGGHEADNDAEARHDTLKKNIHSSKSVLGEVIGINTRPTIGESIGSRSSAYDTVAKMQVSNQDLRHSIGVNDKFIILRDLFAGNNARYKEVIDRLGEFTSLDDAMIYIQESHGDWDPDCEGAKIIVDLLTKRLG